MNGVTTTYYYAGDALTAQKTGTQTMRFILNAAGEALGFTYGGITYYYAKNLQGDVTALTNNEGDVLARYAYDAWGRPISVTATNGNATYLAAANANPYRYRGYYYDAESGWYFLTTRYYVPEWGRFLTE